jgi:hypothetical protein
MEHWILTSLAFYPFNAFIMDTIISSGKFKPKEIRQLNYCREYLQVLTVSDITRADGKELDYAILHGHHHPKRSSKTKLHHFNQDRPADRVWKVWQRANLLWSDSETLKQALGPWIFPHSQQRQISSAYYNRPDQSLYIPTTEHYYRRVSLDGDIANEDVQNQLTLVLPATALPTMMTDQETFFDSPFPTMYHTPSGPLPGTF